MGASSNPTTSPFEVSGVAAAERTEDGCKAPEAQTKVTLIYVEAAPARMHVILQASLALATAAQTSGQRFSLKVSGGSDIVVKAAPGDRIFAMGAMGTGASAAALGFMVGGPVGALLAGGIGAGVGGLTGGLLGAGVGLAPGAMIGAGLGLGEGLTEWLGAPAPVQQM